MLKLSLFNNKFNNRMKNTTSASVQIIIVFLCFLLLGCKQEGETFWECSPYENCTIFLNYDNSTQLAVVNVELDTATGSGGTWFHLQLSDGDTLIKKNNVFYKTIPCWDYVAYDSGFSVEIPSSGVMVLHSLNTWQCQEAHPTLFDYVFYLKK